MIQIVVSLILIQFRYSQNLCNFEWRILFLVIFCLFLSVHCVETNVNKYMDSCLPDRLAVA